MRKNNKDIIKKWLITVPAAIALLALYMLIFGFSDQDAEESGSLSLRISENAVEFYRDLAHKDWTPQYMEDAARKMEHPIRKLAHFSEYTCVGILVYLIWAPWIKRGKKLYLLVTVWVFVSGALDEFHQRFVPGRWGSIWDALLDTSGGVFGIIICVITLKIFKKLKERKPKKAQSLK